jgi:hypothetical protein
MLNSQYWRMRREVGVDERITDGYWHMQAYCLVVSESCKYCVKIILFRNQQLALIFLIIIIIF